MPVVSEETVTDLSPCNNTTPGTVSYGVTTQTNEQNLFGLRRVAPVLFSVPGQLYDFDPVKTNWLKTHNLEEITAGTNPSPIDADQFGKVCSFWLNEFNTDFDEWVVLHRLNWVEKEKKDLPATTIQFADLGLDAGKEYLVYEFWDDKMLGVCKKEFSLPTLAPNGIESLAIREKTGKPQLLSTNRHLSQGGVDIEQLVWTGNALKGRSRVIAEDKYVLTFYVPSGYSFESVTLLGERTAVVEQKGNLLRVKYTPEKTESIEWNIAFRKHLR